MSGEPLGKDEIEWLEKQLDSAFWGVLYHEEHLAKAHKKYALARAVFSRAFPDITEKEALEYYEGHDDDEAPGTLEDYAREVLGEENSSREYHENGLADDHVKIARVKAIIQRANLGAEIPADKVAAAAKARFQKER